MRRPPDWMSQSDERILEVLRDEGNLNPKAVSRTGRTSRVDVGTQYARDRLKLLFRYGLVDLVDEDLYSLSELGEAFLDEDPDFPGEDLEVDEDRADEVR